jgi:hypothetical protein
MRQFHIHQLDIKGAYLNGTLKERVYMKQPKGYDDRTGCVCRLIKTLYGLKQAGREWNIELDTRLQKRGYQRFRSDPCIYIWRERDNFVIITIWVDDMLLFVTTFELKRKAIRDIESEWEITDLRTPTKIVRIELAISPESISISSRSYIDSILAQEGLDRCSAVSTPLDLNVTIVPNPKGNAGDHSNSYASLLGELQYIANATCPDISYVVNRLASYTANPSLQHTTALKRILQYLCGMKTYCITYKALPDRAEFFTGYADTAYANTDECCLTTGYVFLAGDGAITWCSKKQISTSLSSMQAEYIAISKAMRKACWLWNLYTELGVLNTDMPTTIKGDNDGLIAMARNPQFHKRTKHIAIRWHWIRELVQEGTISLDSIQDPDQTADILTKALPRQKHKKHINELGLVPS